MEPIESIRVDECLESLKIELRQWNWKDHETSLKREYALEEALYLIRNINDDEVRLKLVLAIAQYANEHTPWSNSNLSTRAKSIEASIVEPLIPQIIEYILTKLLKASPKTTKGRNPRAARNKGLRPILGHSTPVSEVENKRESWKNSDGLFMLGSVCFWISFDSSPVSVGLYAAFSLNVIDDSDSLFRTQGCYLIDELVKITDVKILKSLGMLNLFKDELQTSFNFLPRLTQGEVSLFLMKAAYPTLIRLLDLESVTAANSGELCDYIPYLEVLDKNLLGLISHIQGHGEGASNLVLEYLLQFAITLIDKKIGAAVLACASRLNSMLCRLITDPFIGDSDNGPLVIEAALKLQNITMKKMIERQGGSCDLFFEYRYDLMASWTVYTQRVLKYGVGVNARELITVNIKSLRALAQNSESNSKKLENDFQAIVKEFPELKAYFM